MHKKILVALAAIFSGFIVAGCVHSGTDLYSKNDITSAGRKVSRAPAEYVLENQFEDYNPENLEQFEYNGQTVKCNVPTRTETFNGKTYTKFNVTDTAQLSCPQVKALSTKRPWKVKKLKWDDADEKGFQNFVKKMGESKCNTTDKCFSGPGNILRTEEDMLNTFYTDCADFPYYLRAYYAYKKNLPFSFVREIMRVPFTDAQLNQMKAERAAIVAKSGEAAGVKYDGTVMDLRYSRNGNYPVARSSIPASTPVEYDFGAVAPRIVNMISSGFFRMTSPQPGGLVQPDFYSPKIASGNIVPGTALYKTNGHVAVVYDVTPKGEVLFADAHPDNSITRGRFNPDYGVYGARYGGNFKNFRPLQVVNPTYDSAGNITAGRIYVAADSEIPEYSLEQYNGNAGQGVYKNKISDAKGMGFFDWVKVRLSGGAYKLEPTIEMKNEVDALCLMAKDRVESVQKGIDSGTSRLAHPINLPANIYGTEGAWESYSSPGSDIRLRGKMLSIPDDAQAWIKRYNEKDSFISYKGTNLKADLIASYKTAAAACKITYKNSAGSPVTITLDQLINRAALLSFDPYNCPELRWGATGQEAASCSDDANKKDWYRYQQFLRNITEKDNAAVHGQSLETLRQMHLNKQVDNSDHSSKFNILSRLQAL